MKKINQMKQRLIQNRQRDDGKSNNECFEERLQQCKHFQLTNLSETKNFQKTQRINQSITSSNQSRYFNKKLTPSRRFKTSQLQFQQSRRCIKGNIQQLRIKRLSETLSPIILPSTLSQYMIYLQQFYKAKNDSVTLLPRSNPSDQSEIPQIEIEPLLKWLESLENGIKKKIRLIVSQNEEFALIKQLMQNNILPLIKKNTKSNQAMSYSQILCMFINNSLNHQRQTNLNILRLNKQLQSLRISQKNSTLLESRSLISNSLNQYIQKTQCFRRQNQFLQQSRREMEELIAILKRKNQQLSFQLQKFRDQSLTMTNHLRSSLNKQSWINDLQLESKISKNRSNSPLCNQSPSSKNNKLSKLKGLFDQPHKRFPPKGENLQKKRNVTLLTLRQNKLKEDENNLINNQKSRASSPTHTRHKSTSLKDEKLEKQKVYQQVNSITDKSVSNIHTVERLKNFKQQIQSILIKSEERIKKQEKYIQTLQQKLNLCLIESNKILHFLKKENSVVEKSDVVQVLKEINDRLPSEILKKQFFSDSFQSVHSLIFNQQKNQSKCKVVTDTIEKIKYRDQIAYTIQVINNITKIKNNKSLSFKDQNLNRIEENPDQEDHHNQIVSIRSSIRKK